MEGIVLPELETKLLLQGVTQALGSCRVYVLGYRTTTEVHRLLPVPTATCVGVHYYVMVLTVGTPKNPAAHVVNCIKMVSGGRVTATVLLHAVTDLGTRQPSQACFYTGVLRYGQRIDGSGLPAPYVLYDVPRDVAADERYWYKCEAVAQFYLQAVADSVHEAVGLCKIALLHEAVVQVALGLLRMMMGYAPREYGLRFLLELCGYFSDLPREVFGSSIGAKRYNMLCAPPNGLYYKTRLYVAEEDFEALLACSNLFLEQARVLVLEGIETNKKK